MCSAFLKMDILVLLTEEHKGLIHRKDYWPLWPMAQKPSSALPFFWPMLSPWGSIICLLYIGDIVSGMNTEHKCLFWLLVNVFRLGFQRGFVAQDVASWVNMQILHDYNNSSWCEVWENRLKVSRGTDGPAGLFWWVSMVMWIWPYLCLIFLCSPPLSPPHQIHRHICPC